MGTNHYIHWKKNINHNHSVSNPINNYPKHRQNNKYQQGIGTNHKSIQMHENNPKSLQKQHGYKPKHILNNILSINKLKFHTQTYPWVLKPVE